MQSTSALPRLTTVSEENIAGQQSCGVSAERLFEQLLLRTALPTQGKLRLSELLEDEVKQQQAGLYNCRTGVSITVAAQTGKQGNI